MTGLLPFSSFAITLFLILSKGLLSAAENGVAGVPLGLFATEIIQSEISFMNKNFIRCNYIYTKLNNL